MKNLNVPKTASYRVMPGVWRRMPAACLLLAFLIIVGGVVACSSDSSQQPGGTATPTQTAASAAQQLYTQLTSKQPDVSNSLSGSSSFMGLNAPNCTFSNGTFHVKDTQPNYYIWCISKATTLTNFAFQVDMTIVSGDSGGVMFRLDSGSAKYYRFEIGQDGTYTLHLSTSLSDPEQLLLNGSSPAIKTGLGQTNTIAVIANGSSLSFFVNKQFVASKSQTTLTSGSIGLISDSTSHPPTDAAFSNVQIWNV